MPNYLDEEFFCEVQDCNIPGGESRAFLATVQFLSDRLLITCMDASPKVRTCELYHPTRPSQPRHCPTFHQISYRSIRFVMRRANSVTISGLRKDVHLRIKPLMTPDVSLDSVLESIEGDCPGGFVFSPVCLDEQLKHFLGAASHQRVSQVLGGAGLKFWINNAYVPLGGAEVDPDEHTFDSWLLHCQVRQEAMERIARLLRRQIICSY